MTDQEFAKSFYEFNVKLCGAVKKHKCLYDSSALRKNPSPEIESAWEVVAKECNETIEYCIYRWKSLRKSFYKGIKRKGNRYYLHEYMEFLLSHDQNNENPNAEELLNDETDGKYFDDITPQESLMETIILDEDAESDSHTSADELSEFIAARNAVDGNEANKNSLDNRGRSGYKRTCKRGLDPAIIGELVDEEPKEKRSRKLPEKIRNGPDAFLDDSNKLNTLSPKLTNKKVEVKINKIKVNQTLPLDDNKNQQETAANNEGPSAQKTIKSLPNAIKPFHNQAQMTHSEDKKFMDNFSETRDASTQYELPQSAMDFDNIFINSLTPQLQLMNARQKMNFKRKIYQALMEVFDDATNFPNAKETVQLPIKNVPDFDNTTTGELRLMRELVSLVQAAKNTPEIINAKEQMTTTNNNKSPSTKITPVATELPSKPNTPPLLLSPTLDDDDFNFSNDKLEDDDDIRLPCSLDEIKAKSTDNPKTSNEGNVIGLPRRVIQKVVKVSGCTGSTIVTRDGDKKRIYRIYPKPANPTIGNRMLAGKNSSVGTFYVTPTKNPSEFNTAFSKANSGTPTLAIRTYATKTPNNTFVGVTASNHTVTNITSSKTVTGGPAHKAVHPANCYLSSTTGHFKSISTNHTSSSHATSTPTTSTANTTTAPKNFVIKSPMMPPNLHVKRAVAIRSNIKTPHILQRRYSVCGSLPAEKPTSSTSPKANAAGAPSQTQASKHASANNTQNATNKTVNNSKGTKGVTSQTTATTTTASTVTATNSAATKPIDSNSNTAKTSETATDTKTTNSVVSTTSETAGTIAADTMDPLFLNQTQIKTEPADD